MLSPLAFLLSVLALLAITAVNASATVLSQCGQLVSGGVLDADMDCSSKEHGVIILPGGTLNLAGHVLSGGEMAAVLCLGDCVIDGQGGEIRNTEQGIRAVGPRSLLQVRNIGVFDCPATGIYSVDDIEVSDVTVSGCGLSGIRAWGDLSVKNSVITGCDGNGIDALSRFGRIEGSVVTGNVHYGVWAERILEIVDSEISGNTWGGAVARKAAINNSILENNTGGSCEIVPGCSADITTVREPRLTSVTCGKSSRVRRRAGTYEVDDRTWGACSLD